MSRRSRKVTSSTEAPPPPEGACGERLRRANAQPILQVAAALDLRGFAKRGSQWTAHCLNGQADKDPSLVLRSKDNQWTCHACKTDDRLTGGHVTFLVQRARGCTGAEALGWLEEHFGLPPLQTGPGAGPIEQWARLRGVFPENIYAYGVTVVKHKGAAELHWPMRWEHGGAVVGHQRRRADNAPLFRQGDKNVKSATLTGTSKGLLLPIEWPEANEDSVLILAEGEPDAATSHCLGFPHTVGTIGKNCPPVALAAVENLRCTWPGGVAYIAHGEIPEADARGRAQHLRAVLIRPPVYVAAEPHDRDLNAWVAADGLAAVRNAINQQLGAHVAYVALRCDAREHVHRAVKGYLAGRGRRGRALRRDTWLLLDAVFQHVITHVRPTPTQIQGGEFAGIEVPAFSWLTTRKRLAKEFGYPERTVRRVLNLLCGAGVLRSLPWQHRGSLLEVNVSEFTYMGRPWS